MANFYQSCCIEGNKPVCSVARIEYPKGLFHVPFAELSSLVEPNLRLVGIDANGKSVLGFLELFVPVRLESFDSSGCNKRSDGSGKRATHEVHDNRQPIHKGLTDRGDSA